MVSSKTVNFRGKDQRFVAAWLAQQGLEKLVDVLKVMFFFNVNMYFNPIFLCISHQTTILAVFWWLDVLW